MHVKTNSKRGAGKNLCVVTCSCPCNITLNELGEGGWKQLYWEMVNWEEQDNYDVQTKSIYTRKYVGSLMYEHRQNKNIIVKRLKSGFCSLHSLKAMPGINLFTSNWEHYSFIRIIKEFKSNID